jgi:L-ornithine Nalpha-acyltransferase
MTDFLLEAQVSSAQQTLPFRENPFASDCLGKIGSLETRLARSADEVRAAQSLRYQVFVEEMNASVSAECHRLRRDMDAWDRPCDHLLVLDRSIEGEGNEQIVGTYRLLRQSVARENDGFYSACEFDVHDLIDRHPGKTFMELGRSCVLAPYRTKRTVELLWQGIWAYALTHKVDVLFGCGSFPGTIPAEHALALSFLHHTLLARDEWAVRAKRDLYRTMDLMPKEAIDSRRALTALPPLIKGYLRLGAMIGNGAVVDHAFRTTDVLVVLPVSQISGRYISHFGADAGRFATFPQSQ